MLLKVVGNLQMELGGGGGAGGYPPPQDIGGHSSYLSQKVSISKALLMIAKLNDSYIRKAVFNVIFCLLTASCYAVSEAYAV